MNRIIFACALGSALALFGCSSGSKNTSDNPDDSQSAETDSANLDPSQGGSSSGAKPTSSKSVCGGQKTADACYACCSDQHKAGVAVLNLDVNACICDDPGPCARACGDTFCAGSKQVTQACGQCIQANGNACLQIAETRCEKDKDCAALSACVQSSKCDAKPPAQQQ